MENNNQNVNGSYNNQNMNVGNYNNASDQQMNNNWSYNNQNFNQQMNNQNTEEIVEELEDNKSNEANERKKGNGLLIIILVLIILLLAGYIVYDKVINKEKTSEPVKEPEKQEVPEEPKKEETDSKYVKELTKVILVNGKQVEIEFKYYVEIDLEDSDAPDGVTIYPHYIYYDKFIDGKMINTSYGEDYYDETTEVTMNDNLNKELNELMSLVDEEFGVIKGDKDYLYLKRSLMATTYLDVYDENYNQIFEKPIAKAARGVTVSKNCQNYDKFVKMQDNGYYSSSVYYIDTDALYYIEDDGTCPELKEKHTLSEYKITFKDNKAISEKIDDCTFEAEGNCQ